VLVTLNDKKIGVTASSGDTIIDHFIPQIVSAQDYYPFGMLQPGREFNVGGYRFGFNGKENDNEVKGEGNQQDYGMRVYDPRLGRFLSLDPLTNEYPSWSPYPFAMNRPIDGIDLDGMEFYSSKKAKVSVDVIYNPVLKRVDKVTAYLIYNNVANGLKQKLHASLGLSGDYYDEATNPGGITVASLPFKDIAEESESMGALQGGLEDREGATEVFAYKFESPVKTSRIIKNYTNQNSTRINTVAFEGGEAKANRIAGYIQIATWILQGAYSYFESNYEIPTIQQQGTRMVYNVTKYINQAIEQNVIPKKFLNSESLTSIGNYLVYGEVPMMRQGAQTIVNDALLNIAKQIWKKIDTELKAKLRALEKDLPTFPVDNMSPARPVPKIKSK
jgi:RHS repeat-associated protein